MNVSVHFICKACNSIYLITDCDLLKDVEARSLGPVRPRAKQPVSKGHQPPTSITHSPYKTHGDYRMSVDKVSKGCVSRPRVVCPVGGGLPADDRGPGARGQLLPLLKPGKHAPSQFFLN